MTWARVTFAVARDGYFCSGLAKVHERFRTPSPAIVLQALLAIGLLLFAGSFRQLFSLTLFAEWLFYMLTTGTLFIFRRRQPDLPRPYKTWGYPVVPVVFMLASAVLLGYTFWENLKYPAYPSPAAWLRPPLNSLSTAGVLVILLGIPVYYAFARRRMR